MSGYLEILHIEDNAADAELVQIEIRNSFPNANITSIQTKKQLVNALQTGNFTLVLADFRIPGIDDYEALELRDQYQKDLDLIYVSGTIGEQMAVEALRKGATDNVFKDHLDKLEIAIGNVLERIEASRKLAQSEVLNTDILSSLSIEIAVIDEAGIIRSTNVAWDNFEGWPDGLSHQKHGIGANYLEVCNRYRLKKAKALEAAKGIKEVLDGKATVFALDYSMSLENKERWFTMKVTPLHESRGAVISHTEITDRVLAEREKIELSEIIDRSRNEVVIFEGEHFCMKYANTGALMNLGYEPHEIDQLTFPDIAPSIEEKGLNDIVSGLNSNSFDYRDIDIDIQRKNESIYPASIRFQQIFQNGEFRYLAFIKDLSDKKRDAQAINELARFPEENPNPVLRVNSKGHVTYVNNAGWNLYYLMISEHGELCSHVQGLIANAFSGTKTLEDTIKYGSKFFQLLINPVKDGETVYIFARDITDSIRLERLNELMSKTLSTTSSFFPGIREICETVYSEIKDVIQVDNFHIIGKSSHSGEISTYFQSTQDNKQNELLINPDRQYVRTLIENVLNADSTVHGHKTDFICISGISENDPIEEEVLPELWVAVPIILGGFFRGIMIVFSRSPDLYYSNGDIRFLTAVGNKVVSILDRFRSLEQLRLSEEKYRVLFMQNLSGMYRMTPHGRIIECNDAYAKILGANSKEEVNGKLFDEFAVKSDTWNYLDRLIRAQGYLKGKEQLIQLKSGEEIYTLENTMLVKDQNEEPFFIVGSVIDITDRKQALLKLEKERKQALRYQLMLLSSQLNPHFIYNALNSVIYYILDQKTEDAINYVSEFSKLMRVVLNNSNNEYISLQKEVDFLKQYLNLELERYSNKFEYNIELSPEIDDRSTFIPPMLLQPFVENTIVHGIGPKEGRGSLSISFFREGENIILCTIEDDGIGRTQANKLRGLRKSGEDKSLRGTGIIDTRIKILSELDGNGYEVYTEDLFESNGDPRGTRVSVKIPLVEFK